MLARNRGATLAAMTDPPSAIVVAAPGGTAPDVQRLVSSFLSRQKEETGKAYFKAFGDFQKWREAPNMAAALADLLSSRGRAHELADDYVSHLRAKGLSGSTINQRLSALRSLVKTARSRDIVDWKLEVQSERVEPLRDTRGPGADGVRRLFAAIVGDTPMALRDRAIVRLLYDLGLRRKEVVRLTLGDLDVEGNRLAVLGKGRGEKKWLTLGKPTLAALQAWATVRGPSPGNHALFYNFDPTDKGGKALRAEGVNKILKKIGVAAGYPAESHKISPHKLRHSAVSELLARTSGDIRRVREFSRHAKLDTVAIYDDNRLDLQGEMVALLTADEP